MCGSFFIFSTWKNLYLTSSRHTYPYRPGKILFVTNDTRRLIDCARHSFRDLVVRHLSREMAARGRTRSLPFSRGPRGGLCGGVLIVEGVRLQVGHIRRGMMDGAGVHATLTANKEWTTRRVYNAAGPTRRLESGKWKLPGAVIHQ